MCKSYPSSAWPVLLWYSKLLERLSASQWAQWVVFQWFRPYIADRQQFIRVQSDASTSVPLYSWLLGPLLFSIYAAPIINIFIFRSFGLPCHSYTDDTKSFIAVKTNHRDLGNVMNRVEDCLTKVRRWMDANFLTLKVHLPPKNKFLIIKSLNSGIPEMWCHSFVLTLIIE